MTDTEPEADSLPAEGADHLDGLVEWIDGLPHLVGTRCSACGTHAFPQQGACPRCGSPVVALVPLPRSGTVWTWTIQHHAPKPPYRAPVPFEPFALGYIDLGPLRVESRLEGRACDDWTIGASVELCVGPMAGPSEDESPWSFWFVPQGGSR